MLPPVISTGGYGISLRYFNCSLPAAGFHQGHSTNAENRLCSGSASLIIRLRKKEKTRGPMAPARFSVECQSRLSNGRLERANYAQSLIRAARATRPEHRHCSLSRRGPTRSRVLSPVRTRKRAKADHAAVWPSGSPDDKRCIVHVTGVTLPSAR